MTLIQVLLPTILGAALFAALSFTRRRRVYVPDLADVGAMYMHINKVPFPSKGGSMWV